MLPPAAVTPPRRRHRSTWLVLALAVALAALVPLRLAVADEDADLNELRPRAAKLAEAQAAKAERLRLKCADELARARQNNSKTVPELEKQLEAITAAVIFYQGYVEDVRLRGEINQVLNAMQDLQRRNQPLPDELRQRHQALYATLEQTITKAQQAADDYHRLTGKELPHPTMAVNAPPPDQPGDPKAPAKSGTAETP